MTKKNYLTAALSLAAAVAIMIGTGMNFLAARDVPLPKEGPGVTEVKMLSDWFGGLKGTGGDTPVYVLKGEKEGGAMLVLGGTHANEPSGYMAAITFIETAVIEQGTVYVIPYTNHSAMTHNDPSEGNLQYFTLTTQSGERTFRFGSRATNPVDQWPDPDVYVHYPSGQRLSGSETRNINRAYPGRPDGNLTEKMAYGITQLIKTEQVDLTFDLHEASPEYPVIHATVLKEDLRKAVDLLTDIAFRCIFPEREIEKERGVVLEEINTYRDSPSEQIFDDFEEMLFEGTPLSMPVLGKARYLKKAGRDTVRSYYNAMFRPDNMYFTIVAGLDEKKAGDMVVRAMERYSTSGWSLEREQSETCPASAAPFPGSGRIHFDKTIARHNHQAHCIIGARAYSAYDSRRIPLSLLINILGGPVANSRLNILLREKYGLVYSADASYSPYSDDGVAAIYFGCEKSNVGRCTAIIDRMLDGFRNGTISPRALASAKKQFLGQLAIASDNGEAQVLSMGKSLMTYGRVIDNKETAAMIEAVTAEDLRRTAAEIFAPEAISRLTYI